MKWQDKWGAQASVLMFMRGWLMADTHCCQRPWAMRQLRTRPAPFYQLWDSTACLQERRDMDNRASSCQLHFWGGYLCDNPQSRAVRAMVSPPVGLAARRQPGQWAACWQQKGFWRHIPEVHIFSIFWQTPPCFPNYNLNPSMSHLAYLNWQPWLLSFSYTPLFTNSPDFKQFSNDYDQEYESAVLNVIRCLPLFQHICMSSQRIQLFYVDITRSQREKGHNSPACFHSFETKPLPELRIYTSHIGQPTSSTLNT